MVGPRHHKFHQPHNQALNIIKKTLFTAEAISKGGRWGTRQAPDRAAGANVKAGNQF